MPEGGNIPSYRQRSLYLYQINTYAMASCSLYSPVVTDQLHNGIYNFRIDRHLLDLCCTSAGVPRDSNTSVGTDLVSRYILGSYKPTSSMASSADRMKSELTFSSCFNLLNSALSLFVSDIFALLGKFCCFGAIPNLGLNRIRTTFRHISHKHHENGKS